LVCMAAAGSMVLASLLINTTGRPSDSYVTMDVMRLPLGVLTGVGFIGAGAILHKENFVLGVTTAATLWFSTVMGLCFGAGQFQLGLVLLLFGLVTLWGLRWVEDRALQRGEATLIIATSPSGPSDENIAAALKEAGYVSVILAANQTASGHQFRFNIRRQTLGPQTPPSDILKLATWPGVETVRWIRHP